MDIIRQIELYYANMPRSERKAADAILADPESLANDSVKAVAKTYGTSAAALVRLAKRLGLSGYSELSFQMKNYLANHEPEKSTASEQAPHLGGMIDSFIQAFRLMVTPETENGLRDLAHAMHRANRILAVGIGHSGLAARDLKYLMLGAGIFVDTVTDEVLVDRLPPLIRKGDLVVIFSSSASLDAYGAVFKRLEKDDVTFALVTMNPSAPALAQADIGLSLPIVHSPHDGIKGIRYIDSRPLFDVLVSCLTRTYNDEFPPINTKQLRH